MTWVMNITDIDDKIIRGAAADGETTATLADRYVASGSSPTPTRCG